MKIKNIFFFLSVVLLLILPVAMIHSDVQDPQLKKYITDLKASPNNTELRGKIIDYVLTTKIQPDMPVAADKLMKKADSIMKTAVKDKDFKIAVKALKQASLLAPWMAGIYYNLAGACEKAGQPKEAIKNLNLYLKASPGTKDREQVQKRIGMLEYEVEKHTKR